MNTKSKHRSEEELSQRHAEVARSWEEQLQGLEKMVEQYDQVRDRENIPDHILEAGIGLYVEMKSQAESEDTQAWDGYEEYLEVMSEIQERMRKKLQEPTNVRAIELVLEAETLFEKKQYDKSIQKISEAAALDPEYTYKIKHYRKAIELVKRKGPVRLTRAINKILYPRLRKLGFHHQHGKDSAKWKESTIQVRTNSHGREGGVHMGRTKFGKRFGLNVWKEDGRGNNEFLDLNVVGLDDEALCFLNQEEANAVLERVAVAFEGPILVWLEEE